jgi:hypothetical protein
LVSYVGIGLEIFYIGGSPYIYYRDGTEVDEFLLPHLPWKPGHPDGNILNTCVGFASNKLVSLPCSGFNNNGTLFFFNKNIHVSLNDNCMNILLRNCSCYK